LRSINPAPLSDQPENKVKTDETIAEAFAQEQVKWFLYMRQSTGGFKLTFRLILIMYAASFIFTFYMSDG